MSDRWVCRCGKCRGVSEAADAVQYVWEYCFGSCGVPVVAGVHVAQDGFVHMAHPYWRGDPDDLSGTCGARQFIVSFRPGRGTLPTEGDWARWAGWVETAQEPFDWLLADGTEFRSVVQVERALRLRRTLPEAREILGDWFDPSEEELRSRRRFAAEWNEISARNGARFP